MADQTDDCADVTLRVQGLKNVRAIEFDPITQHVYWIDGRATIRRALENRTQQQHSGTVVVSIGNGHAFDLALDPLGRLLFWTCSTNDALNVTRLDNGSALGVVVKGDGEKPRHIAIHSQQRLLFWTDVGKKRVVRSKMDGKERHVIAGDLLEQPTGLTVDTVTYVVYWSYGRHIECSNFEGGNRKLLASTTQGPALHLAVLFDYLYWYDRDAQVIERVNKTFDGINRRGTRMTTVRVFTDLIAINMPEDSLMETHVCSPFNDYGGCSHFCVGTNTVADESTTTSPRCSCPKSLVLSDDGRTCRAAPVCGNDHFTCAAPNAAVSKDCIPATWKCDGQTDCSDGSDELGCPTCSRNQFKCQNHCIELSWVCDGTQQCPDGSDEAQCCQAGQFQCVGNGVCISGASLCDGWDDCADGSDELPPACLSPHNPHRQDAGPGINESSKMTYIIIILVVLFVIVAGVLSYYYCRKRLLLY